MSIKASFAIEKGDFTLDINLDIPSRGVTAIFGPSGSGKTTLLRAFAGLEYCRKGFLEIGDSTWQKGNLFIPTHKRPLGYVFQEPGLFPHLSVQANLEYGFKRVPLRERKIALDKVIQLLGISHLLKRDPQTLSGGERQRVAIARALAISPKLLLMDEPLASLDQKSKTEILPYLESLHNELEIPVLYVSHSEDEVARLADHLLLMVAGRIMANGPAYEILTNLNLPLSHSSDAEAIIKATVTAHDAEYNLTYLDFPGGRITVTLKDIDVGSSARLRVAAKDVSLTVKPQSETSILNIFPVSVAEMVPEGKARVVVKLLAKDVPLLARVTRKSADALKLKPGMQVYAQVKSVAMLS